MSKGRDEFMCTVKIKNDDEWEPDADFFVELYDVDDEE
jgi:hypothetical protein